MQIHQSPEHRMRSYLQLVATGPELSKSLNIEQAEDALGLVLDGEVDAIQSGIFLIALRMKRETDDENIGALNALIKRTNHSVSQSSEVLVIADPFNGYSRGLPATAFLPVVFAACGLPSYCHGVKQAGPKYGITQHMIMQAAGKSVVDSAETLATKLSNPDIGWGYIDQASYAPQLHGLVSLRDRMVKRTCLSTLEVVLKPVSGTKKTHLMTGFVHKAYPPVYVSLARQAGFDSAMITRGVEGGCIPSLSQVSRYFDYKNTGSPSDQINLNKLAPLEIGIMQSARSIALSEPQELMMQQTGLDLIEVLNPMVDKTLELGMDALSGKKGPMYDSLVYATAIGLCHVGISNSLVLAADLARQSLDSGKALDRFKNG